MGKDASAQAAINIAEGFNLGFAKAKPGNGPLMHTHNTNETFMPITGTWRCEFNEGDARDHVDLGPLDVVAFPPGMARRGRTGWQGQRPGRDCCRLAAGSHRTFLDDPAAEPGQRSRVKTGRQFVHVSRSISS